MQRSARQPSLSPTLVVLIFLSCGLFAGSVRAFPLAGNYRGEAIQNAPDPSIIAVPQPRGETHYYMYSTNGPLNDNDRAPAGYLNTHLMMIFHSTDLVNWTYAGDVFQQRPKWTGQSKLIAPEIQFYRGKYFLYYTAVVDDASGNRLNSGAIGVATSASPTGPWANSGKRVVEYQEGRWIFDPFIIADESEGARGQRYLFYGSYAGGLFARKLSGDGLSTDRASEVPIAVPDRYEATYIRKHDGWYYLFASSTNCCNVELTGYSILVGRSRNLLGPYVDRTGASFLDSRAGGTPLLSPNGNRWIGTGHNSLVTDYAGQDWILYAAVDRFEPSFRGINLTKRAPMLDPLDWVDGWPAVRGGFGASETLTSKPAAQPGSTGTYRPLFAKPDTPGALMPAFSDEFNGGKPLGVWARNRVPQAGTFGLTGNGTFSFAAQARDLQGDGNDASVLTKPAPAGEYIVETRLHFPIPPDSSIHNYIQAGLMIYGDDDHYIKLVHLAWNGTRQIEFAKETPGGQRYGNMLLSPPADWTYLRIVKRLLRAGESYTAYTTTQTDSAGAPMNWIRGGTWTHSLGPKARIGLVSMDGTGITAEFDYIRVSAIEPRGR
ncbi:MAG: family 43 glycosylhydrolase [Chthoniobacterales bacterium]